MELKGTNKLFDLFWSEYPRHENRVYAFQCFVKLYPSEETLNDILEWLRQAKQSRQWQDISFIPHASTWLNQRRWLGDPPPLNTKSYVPDRVGQAPKSDAPMDPEYRKALIARAKHEQELFGE